jgi:hypothetical protein
MMRRHLLVVAVLIPTAALGIAQAGVVPAPTDSPMPVARPCDSHCSAQWMDANLHIDQLQLVGTAESYKQRPNAALMGLIRMGGKKDAEALDYGQPPITAQLDSDVRALSFDVAYDPKGGAYKNPAGASMAMDLLPEGYVAAMARPGFKVVHVLDVDYQSSCLALRDCLKQVADWSSAHPRHLPIVITLHTNDVKTPMPGATRPLPCDATAMEALEGEVRAAFATGQIITPDMVQGHHASLREAVLAHDWPRLGAARGKVIVVLDDSAAKVDAYRGTRANLEGRAMFVTTDAASPVAAFLSLPDPVKDGSHIAAAVQDGFMVITRADADTREARTGTTARRDAAFRSGAQVVQSNFVVADPKIGSYRVSLADNASAMCGQELAPERCVRFADSDVPVRTAVAVSP